MVRWFRQLVGDAELGALARDIERLQEVIVTTAGKLEVLVGRFERMQNRMQMRLARLDRHDPLEGRDAEILREIAQQRRGNDEDDDSWMNSPPDWR